MLRQRLLSTLQFPEVNHRRNYIQSHVHDFDHNCRWIFGLRSIFTGLEVKYNTFPDWLQDGKGIFWINGKPGSGKSSLMDFISRNLRPGGLGFNTLRQWANPKPLGLLSFWFYRPSPSDLMMSMQGFWRFLCFQILNQESNLVMRIRENQDGTAPQSLRSSLLILSSREQSWLDTELRLWFEYLLAHSESKIFLLVDGLDEVEKDREGLLKKKGIKDISHQLR